MKYATCDTKNIRVLGSAREFESVNDLIESGVSSPREIELTGVAFREWWNQLTVAFPDRAHCSSSMVEVVGTEVNVGNPNRYMSWSMKTSTEALKIAEKINADWLAFEGSEDEYITAFSRDKFMA